MFRLIVIAFVLGACGGKSPPPAPSNTGTGSAAATAAPVCHDTTNCEGLGTCMALCAGKGAGDKCDADCKDHCPVAPCPAK